MHIVESPKLQTLRDEHHSSSVQRRVNDLQVVLSLDYLRVDGQCVNLVKIDLVDFRTDNLNQVLVATKLDIFNLHFVYLVDDAGIVWSQHLCAVFPVCLISIVFFRIVTGCDIYACLAT